MSSQQPATPRKKDAAAKDRDDWSFRLLADSTWDWVYWRLPDGRFAYVSPSVERITGYAPNEFLADPDLLKRVIHPDDLPLFFAHEQHIDSPDLRAAVDFRIIHKDGHVRWISHVCQSVTNPTGQPMGRRVSNRDVTDRRQAEEQLRQAISLIEGITQGSQDMIAALDEQFRYTYFNEAYRREFKRLWGQEINVGDSMVEALAPWPAEQRKAVDLWNRALKGETFRVTMEFSGECERQVYELHFNPVRDQAGRQIGAAHFLRNVTERKKTESALAESEQRYRTLFTNMREGFAMGEAIVDEVQRPRSFRFLQTNDAFHRQTGLGPEVIGRPIREVLPQVEDYWIDTYCRVATTGEPTQFVNYNRDTGRYYQVHCFSPAAGQFAILFRDVTAEKQAEESLRDLAERLRRLFEEDLTADFVADPDGTIRMCNPAFVQTYGFANEQDAIGASFAALKLDPSDWPGLLDELGRHRTIRARESEHRRLDGTIINVVENIVGVFDDDGNLTGIQGYVFDDTKRKRAEQALRDSEHFYRETLESIPGMVFTTRPDGYCDYQSLQWVEFTGVPMSEMVGDGWNRLLHPDDRARAYAAWRDAVEERAPYDVEYRVRRHDGRCEWFKVRGRPIRDAEGNIVRWFGVATSIEDRKRAEEALLDAKAELEQKVQERTAQLAQRAAQLRALAGELTLSEQRERRRMAKVLHDHLQQLLVGAKFRTAILRRVGDETMKEASEEIEHLLDESIRAARSLTAELSPPILHEGGLLAGLDWLARWMLDKHGLVVDLTSDGIMPTLSEDVKVLLFESVRELLFNAVKHARVQSVSVNVRQIGSDKIQVTVSDEGPGFDPAGLKPAGETGGGFGLFSIRERLDLIGGRIEIDSAPGQGSRFTLHAPIGRAQPAAAERLAPATRTAVQHAAPAVEPKPGSTIRVLLADDHVVMREGLTRLLNAEPDMIIVGEASDGNAAVELARELLPDVVLMDLSMPNMSGEQATRAIHAEHPQICIIGLSMFEEAERAAALRNAGACEYLTKSGPSSELISAIRRCIDKPANADA